MSTERIDTERTLNQAIPYREQEGDDIEPIPVALQYQLIDALSAERSDAAALRERVSQLEGELAGIELMDAEGRDFLPEYVKQLEERIRLLERAGKQTMFVLTVDVPGYEVDAVVETWKNLLPESPAAGSEEDR